jgi:hypothetical protein
VLPGFAARLAGQDGDVLETSDLIAGLALVASAVAVIYARREARAAEASAESSRRSADAAEAAVQTGQQQLELERERLAVEQADREVATAPAFEPQRPQDAPAGVFNLKQTDGGIFSAHLRNKGLTTAIVERAELEILGGAVVGSFLEGRPGPVSGGAQSTLRVEPNAPVIIQFDVDAEHLLRVTHPLRLDLTYRAADGAYRARLMLELLRGGEGATGQRPQWRAGEQKVLPLAAD